jgi:hypothetical protein
MGTSEAGGGHFDAGGGKFAMLTDGGRKEEALESAMMPKSASSSCAGALADDYCS